MSIGPVSGNGIAVTLPPGKTVFWNVTTQASYNQYVLLSNSSGSRVFLATGASTGGHSPTQIGQGSFVVDATGNYTIYIGINGGAQYSQVLWDDMTVFLNSIIVCSNLNYISEDGADQDFNDSAVSLTWFNTDG
jgi:hypothetical protein